MSGPTIEKYRIMGIPFRVLPPRLFSLWALRVLCGHRDLHILPLGRNRSLGRSRLAREGTRRTLLAPIGASGGVGLPDGYGREVREVRGDAVPDVFGECFAGGVLEPGDLAEVLVVERVYDRADDFFQIAEVHYPAPFGVDLPGNVNVDAVSVPVELATLMVLGGFG